jgi:hypothetical protein
MSLGVAPDSNVCLCVLHGNREKQDAIRENLKLHGVFGGERKL